MATYNRACRFGLDPGALERANDEVLGIVQIESRRAVSNAEEIAAVDSVDVLFVGPRDLSHDLGVPGQIDAPVFVEALDRVRSAAQKHGKACGLLVSDGAAAAVKMAEGWTFITIGSDSTLLAAAVAVQTCTRSQWRLIEPERRIRRAQPEVDGGTWSCPRKVSTMDVRLINREGVHLCKPEDIPTLLEGEGLTWIDVRYWDVEVALFLAKCLRLHERAVRDCALGNPVPKMHVYEDHVFVVLHGPEPGSGGHVHHIELDQFVGPNWVLTVHGRMER